MTQYGSETTYAYNKEEQKGTQVKRMFDSIAETYDQLNHTLSFGIDKIWRRKGIAFLRPFSPKTILDLATGHGRLGYLHVQKAATRPYRRCRHLVRHDGSGTEKSGCRRFIRGTYILRATGLYGLDLRGKLVRCRNRRFRGS